MMLKNLAILILLLVVTTFAGIFAFQWYHADYFFLRRVYRAPKPDDRERLLVIAAKGYQNEQRYTAMNMMLGEALMRLGRAERDDALLQRAREILRKQVKLNPQDPGVLQGYAAVLVASGRTKEADEIFRRLLDVLKVRNVRSKEGPS